MEGVIDSLETDLTIKQEALDAAVGDKEGQGEAASSEGRAQPATAQKKQGHGGWMPKAVRIAKAILRREYDRAESLIHKFAETSPTFKELVGV